MSYGIMKIGSKIPVNVCSSFEEAYELLLKYGDGHEIKRAAFFALPAESAENQLTKSIAVESKAIADKIIYQCGEHILLGGEPQIGKLYEKQLIILHIIKKLELPVIMLFRNFNADYAQFQKRRDEFNNKRRRDGKKYETIPESHDLLNNQDRLAELLKEPYLILGLANPKTINAINDCLDSNPSLKNKACVIMDEGDLATFELEDQLTQTEDALNELFPKLHLFVSVTGTPGSILLCDKITQAFALERPANYYGIDRIKHVPVEPIRSPEKSKQYDPELDSHNLERIMGDILSLPSATLLITPSRLIEEHKSVIAYLSSMYGGNNKDIVYMELNDTSVKVYNEFGKQIEPNGISIKCKGKPVGAIDIALQKYKHMSHIVIVSGALAGRGISFVSSDYERHLTHQYIAASPNIHLETALQSIRLLGKYYDNPELTLYCDSELYEDLKNLPHDMARIINLVKESRTNKEAMPELIELTKHYQKKWLGRRKEKGIAYKRQSGRSASKPYELYIKDHDINEPQSSDIWVESILLNTARSFAKAILAGTWPGGANDKVDGKERIIYMNPLSDFTPEGIQNYIRVKNKNKNIKQKTVDNLDKGYKYLADVQELYRKHPEYEGKALCRKICEDDIDNKTISVDTLVKKPKLQVENWD